MTSCLEAGEEMNACRRGLRDKYVCDKGRYKHKGTNTNPPLIFLSPEGSGRHHGGPGVGRQHRLQSQRRGRARPDRPKLQEVSAAADQEDQQKRWNLSPSRHCWGCCWSCVVILSFSLSNSLLLEVLLPELMLDLPGATLSHFTSFSSNHLLYLSFIPLAYTRNIRIPGFLNIIIRPILKCLNLAWTQVQSGLRAHPSVTVAMATGGACTGPPPPRHRRQAPGFGPFHSLIN